MNKVSDFGYHVLSPLLRLFIFIFMKPKIFHKDRVPKKEGFIFAGTHVSKFDGFMIGLSTHRALHYLAKKELMDKKIIGPIMKWAGLIRVDRQNKNPEAKEQAINALHQNKVICIFPEGTINKTDGYIIPFKYGAVSIAYKSGNPIVPFAIVNKPKLFNYKIKVIIGEPYYVKTDNYENENKILENKVIELIKEGRRYEEKRKS